MFVDKKEKGTLKTSWFPVCLEGFCFHNFSMWAEKSRLVQTVLFFKVCLFSQNLNRQHQIPNFRRILYCIIGSSDLSAACLVPVITSMHWSKLQNVYFSQIVKYIFSNCPTWLVSPSGHQIIVALNQKKKKKDKI